jgi:hypothetical protein
VPRAVKLRTEKRGESLVLLEKPLPQNRRVRRAVLSDPGISGNRISGGDAEEIDSKALPSVRTGRQKGKKYKLLWYRDAAYAISGMGVPQYPPNCLRFRVFLGQLRQRMC